MITTSWLLTARCGVTTAGELDRSVPTELRLLYIQHPIEVVVMDERKPPPPTANKPEKNKRAGRAKRFLIRAAALVALLCVAGAVYQALSERRDLREHPAPGELVDVGGHRLHLHCVGSGKPTVLLEAGLGNDVNHWSLVQLAVAEFTRVCAYDRAGLGWSDPGPLPRDAPRVVDELGRLLERSGESPPYVLVGHSNGGPYVRLYAAAHPERIAGLVLVDPNPENAPDCEELPTSAHALYESLVALPPWVFLAWSFPPSSHWKGPPCHPSGARPTVPSVLARARSALCGRSGRALARWWRTFGRLARPAGTSPLSSCPQGSGGGEHSTLPRCTRRPPRFSEPNSSSWRRAGTGSSWTSPRQSQPRSATWSGTSVAVRARNQRLHAGTGPVRLSRCCTDLTT